MCIPGLLLKPENLGREDALNIWKRDIWLCNPPDLRSGLDRLLISDYPDVSGNPVVYNTIFLAQETCVHV